MYSLLPVLNEFIEDKTINPLFITSPSPILRLLVFGLLSIGLMTADHQHHYFLKVRQTLATLLSPMQYIVSTPVTTIQRLAENARSHQALQFEKEQLRMENLLLRAQLQKFNDLQRENTRLRQLFGAAPKQRDKMLVADVMALELDPYSRKLVINKGAKDGVFAGQPLLDANGVLGQIEHVNHFNSTIALITDPNHELPVQIVRNKMATIAVGMGTVNRLSLLYLPNNSSIRVGDELVTSGLGGQFPVGYPVGKVIEVKPDISNPYALVQAKPFARLEQNREVLLVWTDKPAITVSAPENTPADTNSQTNQQDSTP